MGQTWTTRWGQGCADHRQHRSQIIVSMGRPNTVPIKSVLNKPNSGSRSQFGTMTLSNKVSSSAYSIGTEQRTDRGAIPVSPGPVYVPKPTSKWLGDAPAYSMGTSKRPVMNKHSRFVPAPDTYKMSNSVGRQVESARYTSPRVGIGTEGRQQHTGKRNPVYADTLFPSVPSVGPQLISAKRSYPTVKIGTDSRFRAGADDGPPGPGNYKSRSSVGRQVTSYQRSSPVRTFGVRHSPKANCTGSDISTVVSPGPAGYRLRDSLGRQVNSKQKSSSNFTFGSASRFSSKDLGGTPGPGAYTV